MQMKMHWKKDLERKLKKFIDMIEIESKKKGLTIQCEMTKCKIFSKRGCSKYELCIRDINI